MPRGGANEREATVAETGPAFGTQKQNEPTLGKLFSGPSNDRAEPHSVQAADTTIC
jgi:hypothetical protein